MSSNLNQSSRKRFPVSALKPTSRPSLRFTPLAWAKLLFLRDRGPTEVGGFGISDPADLLLVTDICLIRQISSPTTVSLEDQAVADFFDDQIDRGRAPATFGRIWIHTHPGDSAYPSPTDEATFARVFGRTDWSVMAILACGGQSYARLQFRTGPGGHLRLAVEVDYQAPFGGTDHTAWHDEYAATVKLGQPPCADEYMGFAPDLRLDRLAPDSNH